MCPKLWWEKFFKYQFGLIKLNYSRLFWNSLLCSCWERIKITWAYDLSSPNSVPHALIAPPAWNKSGLKQKHLFYHLSRFFWLREEGSALWFQLGGSPDIQLAALGAMQPGAVASFFLLMSLRPSPSCHACVDCELPHRTAAQRSYTRIPTMKVIFYELTWENTQPHFQNILLVIRR